jgi:hypothetical protein
MILWPTNFAIFTSQLYCIQATWRHYSWCGFISYLERPSNIVINVTSSHSIVISWKLPVTSSDVIQQTEVILYDGNNYMYSKVVYDLDTSLSISTSRVMTPCGLNTVKLRCKYSKVGWSQYHEEKCWATGMLLLSLVKNTVPTYYDIIEEEIRSRWLHKAYMYTLTGISTAQIDQLQDKIKCNIQSPRSYLFFYDVIIRWYSIFH